MLALVKKKSRNV